MTYELIETVCELYLHLYCFCSRIYENKKLVKRIASQAISVDDNILNTPIPIGPHLFCNDKNVGLFTDNSYALGYIKDEASDYSVILGPVKLGETTNDDIRKILSQLKLPQTYLEQLTAFYNSMPIMSIEIFLSYISLFNITLNQKAVTISDIVQSETPSFNDNDQIDQYTVNSVSEVRSDNSAPHVSGDYEESLYYFIKNGMINEIGKLKYDNYGGNIGTSGNTYLRSIKNSLLALSVLCSRAAINGGLDRETACTVSDLYDQRIEKATSINELAALSPAIRYDFCRRVNELKNKKAENPLIYKATKFVNENIYKKITASQIAEFLEISPEYLSLKFKEVLKCSIPQYLAEQKINEAKKLLRFTEKTIVEISTLLAFSSQSYFQNQFKKIRGITPAEYRKLYNK